MNNEEIIVHQYKLRMKGDYYRVCVTGSKYLAEKYMKEEFKADEIIWEKSYVTSKDIAIKLGKKNRIIANQGFFLKLQFIGELGIRQTQTLTKKTRTYDDIIKLINKNPDTKISIKELRKVQKISIKEIACELCISQYTYKNIETNHIIPSDIPDIKDMISEYLGVSTNNIDWTGELND